MADGLRWSVNRFPCNTGSKYGRQSCWRADSNGRCQPAPGQHNDYRPRRSNFSLATPSVWMRLCAEILGNESYVPCMTSLMNLDWQHSTEERKIPPQYLVAGFKDYIWPLLNFVCPRIVCVLTNRVWDTIIRQIEECHPSPLRTPLSLTDRRGKPPSRLPLVFRLPNYEFQTLLIKPHNHPSRALSYDQCAVIGRTCQYFLNHPS